MKSLRGEMRLRRVDGFYFTCGKAEDFTVSAANDFTAQSAISLLKSRRFSAILYIEVIMMGSNKLLDSTMDFAVSIIWFCDSVKGHRSLVNQLERSATSIGANVREANYAQSRSDFIAKLQIALKECYETEYWLELFARAGIVDSAAVKNLFHTCGRIRRMLISSINTAKAKHPEQ